MLTLATEPTSNKKKYVPGAQFGFTDVDKEKDTVYKMTDAVNKTGRFLADQAQQYRLTESNGSTKAWTAVNVGDVTSFFKGFKLGKFALATNEINGFVDKAKLPIQYQRGGYFLADFIITSGPQDSIVNLYPRIPGDNGIPNATIWFNCTTGNVLHTRIYNSEEVNDAKYQAHKLTADNGTTTSVDNRDWNTLKSTGLYYCNPAGANAPLPKGHLILEVLSIDNNANISQRATETLSNRVFKRGLMGSKWTAWTELQTKTHETYRVPLNTSVVKNYDNAYPFELNYANGVVSFCNTFSPIKDIPSGNDGFVIGTIADVRYRPTQTIRTLCQGSSDHVFLLNVGIDGSITASRNRSKDVYNLTFAAGEWCNASTSYTTNDTHA